MSPSSIELYRQEGRPLPYDMSQEEDRAVVICLQQYVSYLERCEISGEPKPLLHPLELEAHLRDLRDHACGEKKLDSQEAHDTVIAVYKALFDARGVRGHNVPANFWNVEIQDAMRESPLLLDRAIACLFYMVQAAMGELVSSAEVARREGVSRAAIHARITNNHYNYLPLGRNVLIPTSELDISIGERR